MYFFVIRANPAKYSMTCVCCYVVAVTQEYTKLKSELSHKARNVFIIIRCDGACLRE